MLSFIKGRIVSREDNSVVIESNGIGYEVIMPASSLNKLPEVDEEVKIFVRLIPKEEELFLIGFLSEDEKKIFELLQTVSGVGVKQALKILSELDVNDIRVAIIEGNEKIFSSVKGLGSKLSLRIILELKDKIRKLQFEETQKIHENGNKKKMDTLLALKVLGYSETEAKRCVDTLFEDENLRNLELEEIIKKALSLLSK
jgi:Holliday junction DNA helicase RuvA